MADGTRSPELQGLLDELEECRGAPGQDRMLNYERILSGAGKLREVPLVHGTDRLEDLVSICSDGALLSRTARGLPGKNKAEAYLGIRDKVYASAGILYPDARAAFIFRRSAEPAGTEASPWDSGAFVHRLCAHLPRPPARERRDLFLKYTLPTPAYREYLVHYVASCYRKPAHYLASAPNDRHAFPDPIGALCEHPRSRNFEVRIPGRLEVTEATLVGVFLLEQDQDEEDPHVASWLQRLDRAGVHIDYCRNSWNYMRARVCRWIMSQVGYPT